MIQIAICDDEEIVVNQIENLLMKIAQEHHIVMQIITYLSGELLEEAIKKGALFDILFLDIHMEDMDGMETARQIRQIDENLILIYVSGDDEYLMDLFQFDVLGFIKKPIDENRLENVFLSACEKIRSMHVYFYYQVNKEQKRIQMKDIMWFESVRRKIEIHCRDGSVMEFFGKLDEIEQRIDKCAVSFLRIHKSYLVNFNMIESKNQQKVVMYDGTELPISEDRRSLIKTAYSRLLGGEISV